VVVKSSSVQFAARTARSAAVRTARTTQIVRTSEAVVVVVMVVALAVAANMAKWTDATYGTDIVSIRTVSARYVVAAGAWGAAIRTARATSWTGVTTRVASGASTAG